MRSTPSTTTATPAGVVEPPAATTKASNSRSTTFNILHYTDIAWCPGDSEKWACSTRVNSLILLARDAFVRTNRRAFAIMFVRLSVWNERELWSYVDLSLWLDSPMFWTPWHHSMSTYSKPSFSNFTWQRGWIWICKPGVIFRERLKIEVKLLLSASKKSYMPRRLPQQRMTLSDLAWPFHTSRTISAVAELLVILTAGDLIHRFDAF